jgi:hypothetical protein
MNNIDKGIIYKLYFKSNPKVIYIGRTSRSAGIRKSEHIYNAQKTRKQSILYTWLRVHLKHEPLIMEVLCESETCTTEELRQISNHNKQGYILKNSLGIAGFPNQRQYPPKSESPTLSNNNSKLLDYLNESIQLRNTLIERLDTLNNIVKIRLEKKLNNSSSVQTTMDLQDKTKGLLYRKVYRHSFTGRVDKEYHSIEEAIQDVKEINAADIQKSIENVTLTKNGFYWSHQNKDLDLFNRFFGTII